LRPNNHFLQRLKAAGVDVTLEIEEGLIHIWHIFRDVPEAQSAIERIGAFIARNC
jgi:acetyl esterase/lipase